MTKNSRKNKKSKNKHGSNINMKHTDHWQRQVDDGLTLKL
jgi:hypothetical protein